MNGHGWVSGLWILVLWVAGCTIEPPTDVVPEPARNLCVEDADCVRGHCVLESGRCSRSDSDFDVLLLDVIPPASDRWFGARGFLQRIEVGPLDTVLEVSLRRPQREFSGVLTLSLGGCAGHSILVTLRRRLEAVGLRPPRLSVESYSAEVQRPDARGPVYGEQVNPFVIRNVPVGEYDIHWQETGYENLDAECPEFAVPQLHRRLSVTGNRSNFVFDQTATPPIALTVTVPWDEDLQDWTVDIVHNITGERLSTQGRLDAANVTIENERELVSVPIRHARISGEDYRIATPTGAVFEGGTLLRLIPPDTQTRPIVYLAGLVPQDDQTTSIAVPAIGPFSRLIQYRGWVWGEGLSTLPVPGTVRLFANTLGDVRGATVTFSKTLPIEPDGAFAADLLPGTYTAEVIPAPGSGFGRYRTTLTVWGPPQTSDAGFVQAGRLIPIPRAAKLTGRLRGPGGTAPTGTTLRAKAAVRGGFTLTAQLQRFIPRTSELALGRSGQFDLDLDCSSCTDNPVPFDILAMPPSDSGFPWLVFRDVVADGELDLDLGEAGEIEVPRLVRGQVSFQNDSMSPPTPYGGPLVRAYALIDRSGNLINSTTVPDLQALPDCIDVEPPLEGESTESCVQRVIPIGEALVDATGQFELALPTGFATRP